jgi:protein TonB
LLNVSVGANGVPTEISVIERSGNRDLDRAALQAARKWRFAPAIRSGKAVAQDVRVPVEFKTAER